MNRPQLAALPKHMLVELYRRAIGAPGDYARNPKSFYLKALDAKEGTELAQILSTIERKPRKISRPTLEKRNALKNAKEYRAICKALVTWGDDLVHNIEALRKLQARARIALDE
jgi:hypothetical protein